MTKTKLWICLVTITLLTACTKNASPTKYTLVVEASRGKLLFAHRMIYSVNENGASLNLNIPKEKELGSYFEWSPDGQWIAHSFTNLNPRSASDEDIYLIHVSDRKVIRLTDNQRFHQRFAGVPSWSPDGVHIVFYANAPDAENHYGWGLYLINLECVVQDENCVPRPMFLVEGVNPDWSPDGKKIVYQGGYGSVHRGIYVVDIQNPSEPVKIGDCDGSPQWSPDGTKIVSVCKGTIQIIDTNGDNVVKYASDGYNPKWSPDGKKIAFIGEDAHDPHLGQPLDIEGNVLSSAVFIMDANGTNITRITKSNEEMIRWFTWISTDSTK